MYELKLYNKIYNVTLKKTHYVFGGLAIVAIDENTNDVLGVITVNLDYMQCCHDEAFIDANNCPWATHFLRKHKIAVWTGFTETSGFCSYPLYRFYQEKLDEMEEY